jgi:hypothetical protein
MANLDSPKALQPSSKFLTPAKRDEWLMTKITVGEELKPGTPVLSPEANDQLLTLYCELVEEVGAEVFDQAWLAVLKTSKFRPDIAEIRKAAGVNHGIVDPMEVAADKALEYVLRSARVHGRQLRPVLGAIVRTTDAEGRVLQVPEREPSTPFEGFDKATAAALTVVGFGNEPSGFQRVCDLPAMMSMEEHKSATTYERLQFERTMTSFRKEWREAYARSSAEVKP